ncbi:MAG: hypothetical protein Q4G64_00905 [bacterium]|nr:hypothetical protein [bacterium]
MAEMVMGDGGVASVVSQLSESLAHQASGAVDGSVQRVVTYEWELTDHSVGSGERSSSLEAVRVDRLLTPDGFARVIERRGQELDEDGRLPRAALAREEAVVSDEMASGPPEGAEYPDLLLTDFAALAERIAPDCPGDARCIGEALIALHSTYVVDPLLGAALWEVLGGTEGVVLLGETLDRLGRPAVALQVPGHDAEHVTVIFADLERGAFLGSESILVTSRPGDGLVAPAVVSFSALAYAVLESDLAP